MNLIKDSWELGISQVLPVQGAQGYVTKYILKFDRRDHIIKPFSLISHGLGIDYLSDQMISYHRRNLISYGVKPGGFHVNLPRYYKDKIFNEYERLVMKKRADMRRFEFENKLLTKYYFMASSGVNPFVEKVKSYQLRLYQSMELYKRKKKL